MYCINRVNTAWYERVSDETLDSLCEVLEELIECDEALPESDVLYSVCIRKIPPLQYCLIPEFFSERKIYSMNILPPLRLSY